MKTSTAVAGEPLPVPTSSDTLLPIVGTLVHCRALAMKLYHYELSGHSYRVRLLLSLSGVEFERIPVNLCNNEHKTAAYLKLNPLGEVPALVDGAVVVTDSTAALVYLAKKGHGEPWLPEDAAGAARVQRWLSVASGELYRGPATARAVRVFARDADFEGARGAAEHLFAWMQSELSGRTWLAAERTIITVIAMYWYTRVADEGELDLAPFPAILCWLENVEGLDGFEPMPRATG